VDVEIDQLLKIVEDLSLEEPQTFSHQEKEKPYFVRKNFRRVWPWVTLLLVVSAAITFFFIPKSSSVKRTIESPYNDGFSCLQTKKVSYKALYAFNNLESKEATNHSQVVSTQIDFVPSNNARRDSLESILRSIEKVAHTLIVSPDLLYHDSLEHLFLRLKEADLYHVNQTASLALEKESELKTKKERQNFTNALSSMGLDRLHDYQKRADDIAVAAELLDNCIATMKKSEDLIELSLVVKGVSKLFKELQYDALAATIIDLKKREKETYDVAKIASEKQVHLLFQKKKLEDISSQEREAACYLASFFPTFDDTLLALLYNPPKREVHRAMYSDVNNLEDPFFRMGPKTLYLSSEDYCSSRHLIDN
jgi:hypothetical protein